MEEIWKDIKGYEGLYQVSNMGRVRSLNYRRSGKTKVLKLRKHKEKYLHIQLYKDKIVETYRVHRLIAEAFIPNPDKKPFIDHINTDRTDNRVENLRWVTHKENMNNPLTIEKHRKVLSDETKMKISAKHKGKHNHLTNSKPILQFALDGELIKKWDSVADAERFYCNKKRIYNCLSPKKKQKIAYNSTWEYYDTDRYLIALMDKTLKERKRVA